MTLSKSPRLSIHLLIFILYACTSCDTTHSQNSLIKSICKTTYFPAKCQAILNSNRKYPTTTIHNLGEIAMEKIEQHSEDTVDMIDRLKQAANASRHFEMIKRLDLCRIQYRIILVKTLAAHADWYEHKSNDIDVALATAKSNLNAVRECKSTANALVRNNFEAIEYSEILRAIRPFVNLHP